MKTFKSTLPHTLKLTGIILLVFTALSCGSHSSGEPARVRSDYNVLLSEANNRGECFDVERYFDALQTIRLGVPALQISTEFSAIGSARRNFMLLLAYRTFNFEKTELENITEVVMVTQKECESINFSENRNENGPVFMIGAHGPDFITASNEEGDTYTYRWVSPTSMKVEVAYTTRDYGCSEGAKIKVHTSKMVYWGKEAMNYDSVINASMVGEDYMAMVSEAVGIEASDLYSSAEKLSSKKLESLSTTPPREDLFDCL